MQFHLQKRQKTRLEVLKPSDTFKLVYQDTPCFMVIDLTKIDAFREKVVLREDLVYCINLNTGFLEVFEKTLEIEKVNLEAKEVLDFTQKGLCGGNVG